MNEDTARRVGEKATHSQATVLKARVIEKTALRVGKEVTRARDAILGRQQGGGATAMDGADEQGLSEQEIEAARKMVRRRGVPV